MFGIRRRPYDQQYRYNNWQNRQSYNKDSNWKDEMKAYMNKIKMDMEVNKQKRDNQEVLYEIEECKKLKQQLEQQLNQQQAEEYENRKMTEKMYKEKVYAMEQSMEQSKKEKMKEIEALKEKMMEQKQTEQMNNNKLCMIEENLAMCNDRLDMLAQQLTCNTTMVNQDTNYKYFMDKIENLEAMFAAEKKKKEKCKEKEKQKEMEKTCEMLHKELMHLYKWFKHWQQSQIVLPTPTVPIPINPIGPIIPQPPQITNPIIPEQPINPEVPIEDEIIEDEIVEEIVPRRFNISGPRTKAYVATTRRTPYVLNRNVNFYNQLDDGGEVCAKTTEAVLDRKIIQRNGECFKKIDEVVMSCEPNNIHLIKKITRHKDDQVIDVIACGDHYDYIVLRKIPFGDSYAEILVQIFDPDYHEYTEEVLDSYEANGLIYYSKSLDLPVLTINGNQYIASNTLILPGIGTTIGAAAEINSNLLKDLILKGRIVIYSCVSNKVIIDDGKIYDVETSSPTKISSLVVELPNGINAHLMNRELSVYAMLDNQLYTLMPIAYCNATQMRDGYLKFAAFGELPGVTGGKFPKRGCDAPINVIVDEIVE